MKNRIFMILTAIVVAMSTSSCFEIFEEITFHKDGSGHLAYKFDFEQSKAMMGSMGMEDEEDFATKMKESMNEKDEGKSMDSVKQVLEAIDGISNFKIDFKGFAMIMEYDFANSDALNKALVANEGMGKMGGINPSYSFSSKAIVRSAGEMDEKAEKDPNLDMVKMMMKDATYSLVIHLPGKSKKIKDKDAKITNGKKTVTLTKNMLDLIDDPTVAGLKVKYKADK